MKFGRNLLINDEVRVSIITFTGGSHFGDHLGYQTKTISELGGEFDKTYPYTNY